MSEKTPKTPDALIDEVRKTRRKLVAEHGGLQGWVKYLQERQKERPERVVSPPKRTHKLPT